MFSADAAKHWERLARADPYFSVLTAPEYRLALMNHGARQQFFRSGEEFVTRVLSGLDATDHRFQSVLDFGCGVGRLSLPLARRSEKVTAVDVSPTMLKLASENARVERLYNVITQDLAAFMETDDVFDFVNSYLVFQHIPPKEGYVLLALILSRLAPGGYIAVHFPYWRSGSKPTQVLRWLRSRVPGINATVNLAAGKSPASPYMQLNVYRLNQIVRIFHDQMCPDLRLLGEREEKVWGVIVLARKLPE